MSKDSDLAEYFQAMREYGKEKRNSNLTYSTKLLRERGIPFESKNNDTHLIVCDRWDFWPTTGLFIDRITKKKSRGVNRLLRAIREVRG